MCYYVTSPVSTVSTHLITVHNYLEEVMILYDGKFKQHTGVLCDNIVVVVRFSIRLQHL